MTIKTMRNMDATQQQTNNGWSQAQLALVALVAFLLMAAGGKVIGLFLMSAGIWGPGLVIYWLIQTANHTSDQ